MNSQCGIVSDTKLNLGMSGRKLRVIHSYVLFDFPLGLGIYLGSSEHAGRDRVRDWRCGVDYPVSQQTRDEKDMALI